MLSPYIRAHDRGRGVSGPLTVAEIGEAGLLRRLARQIGPPPAGVLGPGDDAALVPRGRGPCLLTTDVMVEGTHFQRAWFRPEELGMKSLAANLSDAAAMGGRPRHALISLILPAETRVDAVLRIYRGLARVARRAGVTLVGGNVARGKPLSVTVALTGDFPDGKPLRRAGARPGDRIYVTGQPGLAYLGLRLLLPEASEKRRTGRRGARPGAPDAGDPWAPPPRREPAWRAALRKRGAWEARAIRRFLTPEARLDAARALRAYRPTAMIDVSDGLDLDLNHVAETGARLVVEEDALPIPPGFAALAEALELDPVVAALHGGEDYELLFTLAPGAAKRLGARARIGRTAVHRIGRVEAGRPGAWREGRSGATRLAGGGFRHFE
jgi:thiamine-monophosphate kinase